MQFKHMPWKIQPQQRYVLLLAISAPRPLILTLPTSLPSSDAFALIPILHVTVWPAQAIADLILYVNDVSRQCYSQAKEHKERPLPAEGVERHAEHEPPYKLEVSTDAGSVCVRTPAR